jgi:O-antigen/teichoic acid export membrane protein
MTGITQSVRRHRQWLFLVACGVVLGLILMPLLISYFGGTPATALVIVAAVAFLGACAYAFSAGYSDGRQSGKSIPRLVASGLRCIWSFWWSLP